MFKEESGTFNWSWSKFDASHRTLFQDVLVGAFVAEEVLTPPNTGMKHFGAFLQLAQVMKATVDDVKIWSDIGDFSHVQDLLRVAAIIFGLSPERLAAEVQYFYEGTGDQKRFRECFYVMDMVPSVDAPEDQLGVRQAGRIRQHGSRRIGASSVIVVEIPSSLCTVRPNEWNRTL